MQEPDETLLTDDFLTHLQWLLGDDAERLRNHSPIVGSLRVNPHMASRDEVIGELADYGLSAQTHPLCNQAVVCDWSDAEFGPGGCLQHYLGYYAVQSLGSMVPPLVLDPQPGERVLDLCAAPGSKTSQMVTMMNNRGLVVANDYSSRRLPALASSLDRAGALNTWVTLRRGEQLPSALPGGFDAILADVPCTGLGRSDNLGSYESWWRRRGPTSLPEIQFGLLVAAIRMAKVGGRIVYSTCSLAATENELVLNRALRKYHVELEPIGPLAGLTTQEGFTSFHGDALDPSLSLCRRITPWENPTEGFFVARLRKTAEHERHARKPVPEITERPGLSAEHEDIAPVFAQMEELFGVGRDDFVGTRFWRAGKRLWALGPDVAGFWDKASRAGLPIAYRRQGVWRPTGSAIHRMRQALSETAIDLSVEQFNELAEHGEISDPRGEGSGRWVILAAEGIGPFASAFATDGLIKWRRPRRYRLASSERTRSR